MHRQIFSTIFFSFVLAVFGSLFASNVLAIFQDDAEDEQSQAMQEFMEFQRFKQMKREMSMRSAAFPPPSSEIIIVPNPDDNETDPAPAPCKQSFAQNTMQNAQSAAQVTAQYQQDDAFVFQVTEQTAQVSSCTQSTAQSTSQQGFCIGSGEPVLEESDDSSSSSSSDDDSSIDAPVPTPTAQKNICNMQMEQRSSQILVEDFYQYAKNKLKNSAPLENIRSNDVHLNGRSHSKFGRLGNLFNNWRGSNWSNVSLMNAHIEHVRQSGSTMDQCEINGKLEHSRYRGTYISNTTFSGDLTDVKFSKSELDNVIFSGEMHKGGSKRHISFRKAKLFGVKFIGKKKGNYMDISHVNFNGAFFDDNVSFTNVDIGDADCFKGARANINGETWYINDDRRKQIAKQFRHGKITNTTTMREIMSKVNAPR